MGRIPSIALLIVGILLLVWGIKTSDSVASGVSEVFTGSPSTKAIWLIIGGVVCTVAGIFGILRRWRD